MCEKNRGFVYNYLARASAAPNKNTICFFADFAHMRKIFSRCRKSFPPRVENFVKKSKNPDTARVFAF
jgi:Rad3-related DNA helicase